MASKPVDIDDDDDDDEDDDVADEILPNLVDHLPPKSLAVFVSRTTLLYFRDVNGKPFKRCGWYRQADPEFGWIKYGANFLHIHNKIEGPWTKWLNSTFSFKSSVTSPRKLIHDNARVAQRSLNMAVRTSLAMGKAHLAKENVSAIIDLMPSTYCRKIPWVKFLSSKLYTPNPLLSETNCFTDPTTGELLEQQAATSKFNELYAAKEQAKDVVSTLKAEGQTFMDLPDETRVSLTASILYCCFEPGKADSILEWWLGKEEVPLKDVLSNSIFGNLKYFFAVHLLQPATAAENQWWHDNDEDLDKSVHYAGIGKAIKGCRALTNDDFAKLETDLRAHLDGWKPTPPPTKKKTNLNAASGSGTTMTDDEPVD